MMELTIDRFILLKEEVVAAIKRRAYAEVLKTFDELTPRQAICVMAAVMSAEDDDRPAFIGCGAYCFEHMNGLVSKD